jgi:hypothetical protein
MERGGRGHPPRITVLMTLARFEKVAHQVAHQTQKVAHQVAALNLKVLIPESNTSTPEQKYSTVTRTDSAEPQKKPVTSEGGFVETLPANRDPRFEETLQQYLGIFAAAGKPLSHADVFKARARWKFLDVADRLGAIDSIRRIAGEREARYIPTPVHHMDDQDWKRVALPRVLPLQNAADRKMAAMFDAVDEVFRKRGIA